uniref:HELP domain-containing protein n=1 Tax=Apteryx owenii TaxID=8824 RepID=A0A8B9PPI9_APTOW
GSSVGLGEGTSIRMFLRGRPITMYIPSGVCNYEELRTELPARRLQLDWVYGYRGRDSRSNLYVLASGELVYFIACAVVLYHVAARRQRHYLRHTDCVRCLSVHPDRVRVATGQAAGVDKDGKPLQPVVHIWDSSTLLTLQQIGLGSFERGVGSLIPERFGAVRTIAEGAGDELLVGTTRNALLRGSLAAGFAPIVQGHTDELWGLATHPSRSLFLTCGHDRQLCVWDSREHALAWSLAREAPPSVGRRDPISIRAERGAVMSWRGAISVGKRGAAKGAMRDFCARGGERSPHVSEGALGGGQGLPMSVWVWGESPPSTGVEAPAAAGLGGGVSRDAPAWRPPVGRGMRWDPHDLPRRASSAPGSAAARGGGVSAPRCPVEGLGARRRP